MDRSGLIAGASARRRRIVLAAALPAVLLASGAAGQAGQVSTIARSDHPDPARRLHVIFPPFNEAIASTNPTGEVVVFRTWIGNDRRYWSATSGGVQSLALDGLSSLPNGPFLSQRYAPAAIDSLGNIFIAAEVLPVPLNPVWHGSGSSLQRLVVQGQSAPGQPQSVTFTGGARGLPSLQDGFFAARLGLQGSGIMTGVNDEAVYGGPLTSPQLIASLGGELPGAPGMPVREISRARAGADGSVIFYAGVFDGINNPLRRGVWAHRDGQLTPAAVPGQSPFAGAPVIQYLTGDSSNRMGVAVVAGASSTHTHLWLNDREGTRPLLSVPLNPAQNPYPFLGMFSPLVNDRGDVFFAASSQGNPFSIWRLRDGTLDHLLSVGDTVTGPAGSAVIGQGVLGAPNEFDSPTIRWSTNALGQVVFCEAQTSGESSAITSQIITWDPALGASLLAKVGAPLTIGPGDVRTVNGLNVAWGSTGGDGRPTALSDTGLLVFTARFTDGSSGVFTATVPAPSAVGFLPLAWLALRRRR